VIIGVVIIKVGDLRPSDPMWSGTTRPERRVVVKGGDDEWGNGNDADDGER